jgi:hypothetical protein
MIIRKIIKEFNPELFWKLLKTAKKSKKLINTKIIKLIDIILFIPQNFVIFLINIAERFLIKSYIIKKIYI